MNVEASQKVKSEHLKRNAYLYIRQSTIRQVFENTESTKRQYDLRQRAAVLGWTQDRIIVIDTDLGLSGASATDREGFQKLVAEVGMGRAGIVLGLEVSRLARNSTDWHRLLEICALSDTLILDEDGIYDPGHFNDRLLLGLKGTMSEAELHVLRARLTGGILNKARRGELIMSLPVGLVYNAEGETGLDPDAQVQQSLRFLFEAFRRSGSALGTVKAFREEGLLFPQRMLSGPCKGETAWAPLRHHQVLPVLHNPRYAGAFVYGRTRTRRRLDGSTAVARLSPPEWNTFIPGAHAGYISWEEYQDNQRRLRESAQAQGKERRKSPPREGPALLQGLVVCGQCGTRMTVRYHSRRGALEPEYRCQLEGIEQAIAICQRIPGASVDQAVGEMLVEAVTPLALEVALAVQEELRSRINEAESLRHAQIERARYEAELAQRRYMRVDPDNRLVADSLEADWNKKLRALNEVKERYEAQQQRDCHRLSEEDRAAIFALANDFPAVWRHPQTHNRDRKRMVRLLLEDVTLIRGADITIHIRFKGGRSASLNIPLPLMNWQVHMTAPHVVAEVDRLLDSHTDSEVAASLNERGFSSGEGKRFTARIVARIRRSYNLKHRRDRLRATGLLTVGEIARLLDINVTTVGLWRRAGRLRGFACNDKDEYLYDPPGENPPKKRLKRAVQGHPETNVSDRTKEVQYET
jgi:DNA invertase Pin-like site-specific DNA recombinase